MEKLKVIHTLFSGLGGPGNVVFPLMNTDFSSKNTNKLIFYGTEQVLESYIDQSRQLNIDSYTLIKKPRRYLSAFKTFSTILKNESPSHIFIHSSELIIPAIRYRNTHKNCAVFYVEHENHSSKGKLLRILSGYAGKRADGVICLSPNYSEELKKRFSIKAPIHIIPNGVDTDKFVPASSAIKSPVFGMASRMIPGKDHITLLHAFKQVLVQYPSAQLKIAGEGGTLESTVALAETLGITKNVTFLGLLNEDEMVLFYHSISIYVLATKSENLSTALLQAMSCSLPIITSNIENNKPLIQPRKTGWLYLNENIKSLVQEMISAINYLDGENKMGQNSRGIVIDAYSNAQMFEKYSALLQHENTDN